MFDLPYEIRKPHLSEAFLSHSGEGLPERGNSSFHSHGLHASIIARELCPRFDGWITGSSAPLQARLMMSMSCSGSERVHSAHITWSRSVTSMSSSTTIT